MVVAVQPTGESFCGCGNEVSPGAFFQQGHDKKVEGDLDAVLLGDTVVNRLIIHGFGPGGVDLDERSVEIGAREAVRHNGCNVSGVPGGIGMRRPRATHESGTPSAAAGE